MSISTSPELRCPRCDALVRAGSDWCTLCYSDLREPAPAAAVAVPAAPDARPAVGPADPPALLQRSAAAQQAGERPSRPRGKHARTAPIGTAQAAALDPELRAEALVARLKAAESGNPFGRWSALLDSPGKKVAVMAGGAVLATSLLFLVMVALGTLL